MARIALLVLSLAVLAVFALILLWPSPRTFAVQAATRGMTVVVNQAAMSKWFFDSAVVCFRNGTRPSASGAKVPYAGPCDPALFDVVRYTDLEVEWPNGIGLEINKAGPDSPLIVQIDGAWPSPVAIDDRMLGLSDLLMVPAQDWLDSGTLTIGGTVVIGRPPGPGESGNLLSGSYRVSERLMLAPAPVVLAQGDLISGDQVQVLAQAGAGIEAAQVFGFIEPRNSGEAGLGVTFYSAAADTLLSIDRFGSIAIPVAPNWVDRFLVNPTLLGASALLALISGLAGLNSLGAVLAWAWDTREPQKRAGSRR